MVLFVKYNEEEITYKFTRREIDVISEALKTRINHIEGLILLSNYDENNKAYMNALLRESKKLQEKTTYYGQSKI